MPDIASVVTAALAGGLAATAVTAWSTARGERLADQRALRDRRAERLRDAFRPLLRGASTMADIVHRQRFLFEGETEESRDNSQDERYRRAMKGVDDAQLTLLLEPRASGITELFRAVTSAYADHQTCRTLNEQTIAQGPPPGATLFDLGEKGAALDAAADRLGDEMIRTLAELVTPVPPPLRDRALRRFPWLRHLLKPSGES
jgi:hypothetical protein